MRSRTKKLVSMLCVAAMLVSALPVAAFAADGETHDEAAHANVYEVAPDAQLKGEAAILRAAMPETRAASGITKQAGDLESAYIEWAINPGETRYEVFVKAASAGTWTKLDKELVREYSGHMRADALGLKAGTYQMKVVPYKGDAAQTELVSGNLEVLAQDRSGYAFTSSDTPGAYKADGTLKDGAVVVYITEETKDTVTIPGLVDSNKNVPVGIGAIVQCAYKKKDNTTPPICFRLIGTITDPANMPSGDLYVDGGASGPGKPNPCKGLTIEGVGNDAVCNGFGIVLKGASYVEIRNLGMMNCDSKEKDEIGLQQSNTYCWVHNNDVFYGNAGSDGDQAKGDGALDTKKSTYITHSYNHFWDCGKCNLQGMKDETTDNYITYHHNWYDHSDSRHPRVRTCTVHVYNNYYDGNAKYGIGATMGSSIFAENNYFRNCNYPMMSSNQGTDAQGDGTFSGENGGIIKAYGNIMVGAKKFISQNEAPDDFDAYVTTTRNEKVPATVKTKAGGTTYNNFDTASGFYTYTPDKAQDVPAKVTRWAGRVEGGDFQWIFNNAVDDADYSVNKPLKSALMAYKTSLLSVGGGVTQTVSGGSTTHTHTPGAWKITKAAGCDPDTQELVDGEETQYCTTCGEELNTRTLAGAHSNDGQGKCAVCGKAVSNGGGAVVNANSKQLKASDFTMTNVSTDGKKSSFVENEVEDATEGYFHSSNSVVKRNGNGGSTEGTKAEFFELPKKNTEGFSFTVEAGKAPAMITVAWGTPKDSQSATLAICKQGDGTVMSTETKGGKSFTTTLELKEAGTYLVTSAETSPYGTRVFSIIVTEAEKTHTWSAWETVIEATCGQDGLQKRVCLDEDCDKTETRHIDATGDHTWGGWVADDDGDETRTCSVCGETETKSGNQPTPPDPVAVTAVVLNRSAANLTVGGTVTLTATVSPNNADDKTVTWSSSDTAVATVANGVVTAKAVGTATITATAGSKSATCTVTVKAAGGTSTETREVTYVFNAADLTASDSAKPDNSTDTTGSPKKPDGSDYFTVNYGTGSKVEAGHDATFDDGFKGTQRLTMGGATKASDARTVSFTTNGDATVKVWWVCGKGNKTDRTITLYKDGTQIKETAPGTADEADISTFDVTGAGTYAVGCGVDKSYIFKIEVTDTVTTTVTVPDDTKYVDTVTVTPATATLNVGETATLTATVTPADATNNTVTWTSSDDSVATVANGVVTAKSAGEAIITATADGVNGLCTVTVTDSGNTPTPPGPSGDDTPSGGGGGGGGSSTPTKKPAAEVTPGDDTFLTIDSATKDNVAVAELSDKQMSALTNNAVKNNSANIVVTVNALNSVGTSRVNVSAKALDNMADKTDAALTIQTPVGDVKLPAASVADLGGNSGKTITVMVGKTDDGVKLTVAAGNKILDKVAGGVTAITEAGGSGSVAYLVGADGSEKLVKKSYVEAGKLHANLPGSGTIVLKNNAKTFQDTETNWAKDAIGFAASRELFNGVNELDFAPNQKMTRSMLVTVLYRLEGAVNKAGSSFKDVPADSWYADAVAWANAEGIVSGKLEGYFGPDDDITREQLATILYRYATKLCGMDEVSESSKALEKFSDAAVVSGYAEDGMKWAVQQGIIGGRGDGTLAPSGFASRAEVATMLMRFVKAIV